MRQSGQSPIRAVLLASMLLAASALDVRSQAPSPPGMTLFEGARLITGDGGTPIENSAFLIENNRFAAVGRRGEINVPANTRRVDLAGKTVIPALIDAHSHIGYMRDLTSGPQNYTRENILDHMHKFAYFGGEQTTSLTGGFPCE